MLYVLRGYVYPWLSKLTQLQSLTLTTASSQNNQPTQEESDLLSDSISHLKQLQILELLRVNTNYSFIPHLAQLKRLVFIECRDCPGESSFSDIWTISSAQGQLPLNLEYLRVPESSNTWSMNSFNMLSQLQCITLPTIPIDLYVIQEKMKALKHVQLCPDYSYFIKDMVIVTEFLEALPGQVSVAMSIQNRPKPCNLQRTLFHLLQPFLKGKNVRQNCLHCKMFPGSFGHLDSRTRQFFDSNQ